MKKVLTFILIFVAFSLTSCYDDTAILEKLDDHENRIAKLEELCKQTNTNISSLQSIISALQNNDYVTAVAPIEQEGKIIGYTITFSKSKPITIYHAKDGNTESDKKPDNPGESGLIPTIGVKIDEDGCYYWTLDDEWLTDNKGNKVPTTGADGENGQDGTPGQDGKPGEDGKDGITPQLKIEEDFWYISYDKGTTWTRLGKATVENGKNDDSIFQDVGFDEDYLYLTLYEGQIITLPLAKNESGIETANISIQSLGARSIVFRGQMNVEDSELPLCSVSIYYDCDSLFHVTTAQKVQTIEFDDNKCFEIKCDLIPGKTYSYCIEIESKSGTERGDIEHFTSKEVNVELCAKDITQTSVLLEGVLNGWSELPDYEKDMGVNLSIVTHYGEEKYHMENIDILDDASFSLSLTDLLPSIEYSCTLSDSLSILEPSATSFTTLPGSSAEIDALALLAVSKSLGAWIEWDSTDNMENWQGVELWKDGPNKGRVKRVKFKFLSTTESIPYEIQYLTAAEDIAFCSNTNSYLHSLDTGEYLSSLTNIERLTISAYGLVSLHPSLVNLKNLKYLDLSANNFQSIPDILTSENFPNLHAIILNNNQRYLTHNLSIDSRDNLGGFIEDDLSTEKGMESFKRLLKWNSLDTLLLSTNYIQGELPDMKDEGLPFWTYEELKDSLATDITSLPEGLQNLPKVLPNIKLFSIKYNRLTGNIPDWLLYHPNLDLWRPFSLMFEQEGKNKEGQYAGFSNNPVNMDYYYRIYQQKVGSYIENDDNSDEDDNTDDQNSLIRFADPDAASSAGATLEQLTSGELYDYYYDAADVYHLTYTQKDKPIRIILPSEVKIHNSNPWNMKNYLRVNDTIYDEYIGPNDLIGEVVMNLDNSVAIYMDLPEGSDFMRGNINFLDSSNRIVVNLVCTLDVNSK